MYLPPQFAAEDQAIAPEPMRAHPLAQLVSVDGEGLPFVTPLQLHLVEESGGPTLWGHVARPNPQAGYLCVAALQCKLNQHRPGSHAAMHATYAEGNDDEPALARWMQRLGMAAITEPGEARCVAFSV